MRAALACLALLGCSTPEPYPRGEVVIALTVDWEGAYMSPEGVDALGALRESHPRVPLTHFVSAGYFTKPEPDPSAAATIRRAVNALDQVAVHVHAWSSLARAAGVEPKLSPSFLTGDDELVELEDGDAGFDTDLDVYTAGELRKIVRTSNKLLADAGLTPSRTFRAGGFLGTPRLLQAIRDEGFTIDSSAIDAEQVNHAAGEALGSRVAEIWPDIEPTSQPRMVELDGGGLLELPIAAFADYLGAQEIIGLVDAARRRLAHDRTRDVFVVIGFHQETAGEFADRIGEVLESVRRADDVTFVTVAAAGSRARAALRGGSH